MRSGQLSQRAAAPRAATFLLATLVILAQLCAATAGKPDVGLTSALGFPSILPSNSNPYGFYGFYGVHIPGLECPKVEFDYVLYNYGATDLASMDTITVILDRSKRAIAQTIKAADPLLSDMDFSIKIVEMSGAPVTHVVVAAEVEFGYKHSSTGGSFAQLLGVDVDGLPSSAFTEPDSESGAYEMSLTAIVKGYSKDSLDDDTALMELQARFESAILESIIKGPGVDAANGATVSMFGLAEAGDDSVAVAANIFFDDSDGGKHYYEILAKHPSKASFGVLSGGMKIEEVHEGKGKYIEASESSSKRRSLLSASTSSRSVLVKKLSSVGLGVSGVKSAFCLRPSHDGKTVKEIASEAGSDISSAIENNPKMVSELSSDVMDALKEEMGSEHVADLVARAKGSSENSDSFYGMYGFYGSSSSSFYGSEHGASHRMGSSAEATMSAYGGGSSSEVVSFYGFRPGSPSSDGPSSSSKPSSPPSVVDTPQPTANTQPVYFTAILQDYNMEDIENPEDLEALRELYIRAVEESIALLGITSDPVVSVLGVKPGSIAIDTLVLFINDPVGASLFQEVLDSSPSLLFPSFSSVGTISIVNVATDAAGWESSNPSRLDPDVGPGGLHPPVCTAIDRFGECCYSPGELDAKRDCCWDGVDECGVCGGTGSTCGTQATVRLQVPANKRIEDKTSPAFTALLADMRVAVTQLFDSQNLDPIVNVDIDTSEVQARSTTADSLEIDMPFTIFPEPANGVTSPSVLRTKAILTAAAEQKMAYQDLTIIGLLDASRVGVCGNGYCEVGELDFTVTGKTCGADCPGVFSCPVGDINSIVGDRSLQCVGKGSCIPATGTCQCDPGYAGANCGVCADGHTASNGVCAKPLGGITQNNALTDGPTAKSSGTGIGVILVGVIFGLVGIALIVVAACWIMALRQRAHEAKMESLLYGPEPARPTARVQRTADKAEVVNEPEIPTRQLTECAV